MINSVLVEQKYNHQSKTRVNSMTVEPKYNFKSNNNLFLNFTLLLLF
jgi:hypothetical protein